MEEIQEKTEFELKLVCKELEALMVKYNFNFADIARCLAIIANKPKKEKK